MINYEKGDLIMFVDAIGHVALATFESKESDARITVKNPLWVSMVPKQGPDGRVSIFLETPSWAFREWFADRNEDQCWDIAVDKYSFYNGKVFSDILKMHYYNSFAPINNTPEAEKAARAAEAKATEKNAGITPPLEDSSPADK